MNIKQFIKQKRVMLIAILVVIVALVIVVLILSGKRGLNKPESVVYDEMNDRYFISNSGDGSVVSMDTKGKITPFVTKGMISPKGLLLRPPYLYVADVTNIQAIDMMNKRIVATYPIEGSVALNDIASDGTDNLYITDTEANCLFIFNPNSKSLQKITNPLLSAPNGIVYDGPRHQMMIVGFGNLASILTYDIRSQEVAIFMETAYSQLDGIEIDELGRIFFSSWKEEMVVMIPQEQNRFIPVVQKLRSPANFAYNSKTKELVIPLFKRNRIHTHKID